MHENSKFLQKCVEYSFILGAVHSEVGLSSLVSALSAQERVCLTGAAQLTDRTSQEVAGNGHCGGISVDTGLS